MDSTLDTAKVAAFLEQFDAYVEARAHLRAAEDGSDDAQMCIGRCASLWNGVLTARQACQ